MAIRISQVKQLCTASELALVEASRKPQLEQLSLAEAKRNAQRARKLFDKWQDQARRQARSRERQVGFGSDDSRSHVKEEIFADALKNFEAQIAKLEKSGASSKGKRTTTPKKARAAGHRESRASVRSELSEAKAELNTKKAKPKKKTAKATKPAGTTKASAKQKSAQRATAKPADVDPPGDAPESTSRAKDPAVSPPSKKRKRPPAPTASVAQKKYAGTGAKQVTIGAKVKKSLVKLSGRTTRMFGHLASRGKKNQARRDQRG